jgi:hypothetical protein
MATPPRLVGCQREYADHAANPIVRQAMNAPCPQSCWIMKRRTKILRRARQQQE